MTFDPSCSTCTTRRSRCTAPPCSLIRSRVTSHIWPGPSRGYENSSISVLITSPRLRNRPKSADVTAFTRLRSLIRCAAQSAVIVRVDIPHTFSVYDLKNVSKSSRPNRFTTQSSTLRSGLIGTIFARR